MLNPAVANPLSHVGTRNVFSSELPQHSVALNEVHDVKLPGAKAMDRFRAGGVSYLGICPGLLAMRRLPHQYLLVPRA